MPIRLYVETPLTAAVDAWALPPGAARHVQVLRVQPGHALLLFDGSGAEWPAEVVSMSRSEVRVRVGEPVTVDRELPFDVLLAVGMPANDRMDALVEKAAELGVAHLQPLHCERSVLRLAGERAERKRAHWQAVAVAACEQSGRTRVPVVEPVRELGEWLALGREQPPQRLVQGRPPQRLVLSLRGDAAPAPAPGRGPVRALSGPEGGLSPAEEDAARAAGFVPVSLGPRVLRADTAPLALLASLARLALP